MKLYESCDSIRSTLITDTNAHTGAWFAIYIIANATFTLLTDANRDGNTLTTSESFTAGTTIYGKFSAITLNSGKVLAYKE